jgi:hypothetical protein
VTASTVSPFALSIWTAAARITVNPSSSSRSEMNDPASQVPEVLTGTSRKTRAKAFNQTNGCRHWFGNTRTRSFSSYRRRFSSKEFRRGRRTRKRRGSRTACRQARAFHRSWPVSSILLRKRHCLSPHFRPIVAVARRLVQRQGRPVSVGAGRGASCGSSRREHSLAEPLSPAPAMC